MRRIAALCITICLLLALCLPASAAARQFTDSGEIQNRGEATLLVALGLISGYEDGAFRPDSTISRAETAKLIALLCTDQPTGGSAQFLDLDGCWAADYICYCAEQGILSGSGSGLFRPQDPVTGRELAKMLLIVTGSDPARYTGGDWTAAVDADAAANGLYARFTQDPATPISRDNACLLIYNAMQLPAIEGYDNAGSPVYATDELMNPITYLEHRFGVVRYTSLLTGNEYADLTAGGKLQEGFSKLSGHTEFAVTTDLSLLGRYVDIYVQDGQVIGTPCASSSVTSYTFTDKGELEQLCRLTDYTLAEDAAYYYNFSASTSQALEQLAGPVEITVLDADGDLAFEQVLIVAYTFGVVERAGSLQVRLDSGASVSALPYQSGDQFVDGQTVQCVQTGGQWFVK